MDREKMELFEQSKIKTQTIKIATTSPQLKDKIRSHIMVESDTVTWFIRFNLELDPTTVSKKTMNVTERNGYIVSTNISYDSKNHVISILPMDCYAQNEYYLLNISKKVKSAKGTNLKKSVNVMFKLLGNQISEFKILQNNESVPKPKKRPKNYVPQGNVIYPKQISKLYTFDAKKFDDIPKDKLPYDMVKFNPIIAVIGVIAMIAGLVIANSTAIIVGLSILGIGLLHITWQFTRAKLRSVMSYNFGVLSFNGGKYESANKKFLKAFDIDQENEYAEYAVNKITFYL